MPITTQTTWPSSPHTGPRAPAQALLLPCRYLGRAGVFAWLIEAQPMSASSPRSRRTRSTAPPVLCGGALSGGAVNQAR